MKRSCPSILELLALDAIAQHGSLTLAAEVLCISVSAVSKQLAGLEKFVGKALLKKMGRGVQLTSTGREYWMKISPSLRTIESATYEARADASGAGVLTLASVPTFLTKWLIPRLSDFRHRYPDVTFSFRQHLGQSEAFPYDIDAAIRYGAGNWSDPRTLAVGTMTRKASTVATVPTKIPQNWARNCLRGFAPSRWPHLRPVSRSAEEMAALEVMFALMRLMFMFPGLRAP